MPKKPDNLKERLQSIQEQFNSIEQAYQELQASFSQMQIVYEFAFFLSSFLELEELLEFVKNKLRQTLDLDAYALLFLDEGGESLTMQSSFGLRHELSGKDGEGALEEVFQDVARSNTLSYIGDTATADIQFTKTTGSLLCLPLAKQTNEVIGVVAVFKSATHAFVPETIQLLVKISQLLAVVLDKILVYEQTRALSLRDELTGLYNRRYFNQTYEQELQRCKRYHRPLAVLMLDIDSFKKYNDMHGHLQGDEVLKKVAQVLGNILRKADILARYGGEEFVILLPEISKEQAKKAADKLRRRIEKEKFSFEEDQPEGCLTVSVGLAAFPEDSEDLRKLLELADRAMYSAKAAGKNCVVWPGLDTTSPPPHAPPDKTPSEKLKAGALP
ncbi:MAG: diguanylate cyclase [bacterium]